MLVVNDKFVFNEEIGPNCLTSRQLFIILSNADFSFFYFEQKKMTGAVRLLRRPHFRLARSHYLETIMQVLNAKSVALTFASPLLGFSSVRSGAAVASRSKRK